jgi:tetratricopeptide (TPR) repeat protein
MPGAFQQSGHREWVAGALAAFIIILCIVFLGPTPASAVTDPEQYDLALTKGLARFKQEQFGEAERFFREALAAKPGDSEASYHLGRTQIRLQRYEAARETFRSLLLNDPRSGRAYLGMGMASYYDGRFQDALTNLEQAETLLSSEALVYFYQGLSHQRLGAYDRSIRPLTMAGKLAPDLAPEVRYLLGLAYYKQGFGLEAKDQLEEVIRSEPRSNLASSASDLLKTLAVSPRSWHISAAASGQYDSNVVVLPLGIQPPGGPTGISRKSDYRTVLQLAGEWRPFQTQTAAAGLSYGVYQSFHRTLHGFDVQDHSPGVFLTKRLGIFEGRVQYNFDYVTVGRDPFLVAHTVQPVLRIYEGRSGITEFQLRYQNKDFQDDRFLINSFRDGKNWLAGVTQYLVFSKNSGHLRLGYTYDTDRTGGGTPTIASPGVPTNADWAYTGHRLASGIELQLIPRTRFNASLDYYRQQYDNPNSFSVTGLQRRADDIYIFSGTISREIRPWLLALFQYGYTRNYSNIAVFDYERSVYSVTFLMKF